MTYRIVKLRSGEELIAVVKNVTEKTVTVERPMQMRIATSHHPVTMKKLLESTKKIKKKKINTKNLV